MYAIGDKISHPLHGAGVIEDIVAQRVNGISRDYYVFRVPSGNIVVMIPLLSCDEIGVRPIIDHAAAQAILDSFPAMEPDCDINWNKRYRDNMTRLKSGDLTEVALVVKSLMQRERGRTLSAGERKMLGTAKQILLSELSLAMSRAVQELESALLGML